MRSLHYILSNGYEVKTLAEAEASGQQYKTVMREIPRPLHVATKQKEILNEGFCPIVDIQ